MGVSEDLTRIRLSNKRSGEPTDCETLEGNSNRTPE